MAIRSAERPVVSRSRRPLGRFLKAGIAIVLLLSTASFGVAIFTGWGLTHPLRKKVDVNPSAYGMAFEEVSFSSLEDQTMLRGWFIPSESAADKTVILAHGFGGNRLEKGPDALTVARTLHQQGYNTLLFDFRGSGLSEGTEVTVGGRETWDLAGAVAFVRTRGARKVGLLGWSMGATTALLAGSRYDGVDAIMADSSYSSLGELVLENAQAWTHLPKFPFTYIIYAVMPYMIGQDLDEIDVLAEAPKLATKPVLLVHGRNDKSIAPHHSQEILEAYTKAGGKQGELLLVDGADHVKSAKVDPQRYNETMLRFFATYLR